MKVVEFKLPPKKRSRVLLAILCFVWMIFSTILGSITAAAEILLITPIKIINMISMAITKILLEAAKK